MRLLNLTLLIVSLSSCVMAKLSWPRPIQDKSQLYERYPQLLNQENACNEAISQLFINIRSLANYEQMVLNSFHGLNDQGYQADCDTYLSQDALYNILTLNITYIPIDINFGLCLPKECTQEQFTEVATAMRTKVNHLFGWVKTKVDLDHGKLITNSTRVDINLTQHSAAMSTWQDKTQGLFIAALSLLVLYSIVFCIMPQAIHCYRHSKGMNFIHSPFVEWPYPFSPMYKTQSETATVEITDTNLSQKLSLRQSQQSIGENSSKHNSQLNINKSNDVFSEITSASEGGDVELLIKKDRTTASKSQSPEELENYIKKQDPECQSVFLSFSVKKAWAALIASRQKLWDNPEIESMEGMKFILFILGQLTQTSQFLMTGGAQNIWLINQFFQKFVFTLVISGNVVMDPFIAISSFFGAYRFFQVIDAKHELEQNVNYKDVLKFYARKYLRLAPTFYLIFFLSWAFFPHMAAGPIWYNANGMFLDCNEYWWAKLLFIGNLYPFFTACNEGCFFWSWPIECDMQIALLIPFFCIAYRKSVNLGYAMCIFTYLLCMFLNGWICYKYDLKTGPFASQNYYLFAYIFQKPWGKTGSMASGIAFAYFYTELLKYRGLHSEEEKKSYKKIHYLYKNKCLLNIMVAVGMVLIITVLFASHTAIARPYSWTLAENMVWFTCSRQIFNAGMFMVFTAFFCGGSTVLKGLFSRTFFQIGGKMCLITALVTAMVLNFLYMNWPGSVYITFAEVLYIGVGCIITSLLVAIALFTVIQFPTTRAIEWYILPYVSADKLIHEAWYLKNQRSGLHVEESTPTMGSSRQTTQKGGEKDDLTFTTSMPSES